MDARRLARDEQFVGDLLIAATRGDQPDADRLPPERDSREHQKGRDAAPDRWNLGTGQQCVGNAGGGSDRSRDQDEVEPEREPLAEREKLQAEQHREGHDRSDVESADRQKMREAASPHGFGVILAIVGRAPVPLEGAPDTEFVVFRGGEGLRDQVAIIVGKPDLSAAVPVRLHSACLTGDLFGSLKCDCGDQLRETVQWMAENEGGILLYLDQEGRGNGISNKMRAYKLQSQGWDTYDADEVLGFDLDQRHFDFAAAMLKQLGVSRVTALTNNPLKVGAIKAAGLEVAATQRVLGRPNVHNVRYLASKRDRAGHFIDMKALSGIFPA